jgi:quinol-cytochrome oxidoreductase complex cytochrome b subunit
VAEVRTEFSRMGIASFVLSLVWLTLFTSFLPVVFLSSYLDPEAAGDVVLLWSRMGTLFQVVALVLGIAGALQRRRKRLFAFIGITCSGLPFVLYYVSKFAYFTLYELR